MSVNMTTHIPKIIQFRVRPIKACVHFAWNAPPCNFFLKPTIFELLKTLWKYSLHHTLKHSLIDLIVNIPKAFFAFLGKEFPDKFRHFRQIFRHILRENINLHILEVKKLRKIRHIFSQTSRLPDTLKKSFWGKH